MNIESITAAILGEPIHVKPQLLSWGTLLLLLDCSQVLMGAWPGLGQLRAASASSSVFMMLVVRGGTARQQLVQGPLWETDSVPGKAQQERVSVHLFKTSV